MNKYLILKGKYGLGNRLQALCEAIIYCQLTGRKLIIDWRDARYSDLQANAFPLVARSRSLAVAAGAKCRFIHSNSLSSLPRQIAGATGPMSESGRLVSN